MADNPVTAALEEIRADAHSIADRGPKARRVIAGADRLLAAVQAVLELTDDAGPVRRYYMGDDIDHGGIAWTLDPAKVREAITRELTGKDSSDGE